MPDFRAETPRTEAIQRRKLFQEVLERLKSRITSGEFPPGAVLPSERELMEQYGVGRPAVREAYQQLERWGMVSISHGERARVCVPSAEQLVGHLGASVQFLLQMEPHSIDHLREARVLMEAGIARLAAERADTASVLKLVACLEAHESADQAAFVAADIAFHRQIAVMSGNPIFPPLVEGILNWLAVHRHELVRAPGAETLTLGEHRKIYEMIAARKPKAAEQAMADHLYRVNIRYRGDAGAGSS